MRKPRRIARVALIISALFLIAFAAYLTLLFRQLEQSFAREEEFLPTRIYSDVFRISPDQPWAWVSERLKALGYSFRRDEGQVRFALHPAEYPEYLIPDGHLQLTAAARSVVLDLNEDGTFIRGVQLEGEAIGDVFLEPELVATLSRGTAESSDRRQIRTRLAFEDIPAPVWQAIIAVEDQNFLEHKGLDPRGIARAIYVNLRTLSFAQGGSTITQQLVKNLMARRTKNIIQKINEVFLALILETRFDKERILERYLNEVYLGQVGSLEVHGVAEGARHFFDKNLEELNMGEIALMAGLIRGPGFYSPYRHKERAMERQRLVLKKMVETEQIAAGEAEAALKLPIRLAPPKTYSNKAPYFTDFVKAELITALKERMTEEEIFSQGFRVYTTLDMAMNSAGQRAVASSIDGLEKRLKLVAPDRLEGALAAVDHRNGYVRVLIGGRNYAQTTFNRILNMRRQVGSTFKPFVYLAAIEQGLDPQGVPYGPGHPAEDAPWKLFYDRGKQTWSPRNYEKSFMGWVSHRKALAHSINTIAAKLGVEVGIENVIAAARSLGIEADLPNVPSLSLGVAELSPVELLRAYATIANHGLEEELTVIRGITQDNGGGFVRFVPRPQQVVDAAPVDLLTDMLKSVFTEGTARATSEAMGFDRPAAGKTGTTSHHRDAWFAGYTPQLTAVVWVGMDQAPATGTATEKGQKSRIVVTGGGSALPIWISFMKDALAGNPPETFPDSPHLTELSVDIHTGKEATFGCPSEQTVREKFITGKTPTSSSCEALWPASSSSTEM